MMAQFDFYGTWEDSWQMLKILLNNNLSIIPDRWYETQNVSLYNILDDELKALIYEKRRVFIYGVEFSFSKPQLVVQNTGPKQGEYSVSAKHGGPCLDLTLPACFERNNKIILSCGTLTYPKEYKNLETNEWSETPEAMKKTYNTICEDFKKLLKRFKCNKYIWIGDNALRLLKSGEAIIADKGI